ncbi:RICIN domain-containing protein [Dyadobacter sp. LHD-138]|nr:RICIN domain-containing protein [Dyadobacter sp. LHD-138]MDQ6482155.1 RICIN domain-containing protein [Dyadobacter sp. LHD-138]
MRNFFCLFIGAALLCPIFRTVAQQITPLNLPQHEDHLSAADYAFGNLNKSYVTTGILYDRAFKNAHLETFSATEPSNSGHWLNAYYELYQGAYNKNNKLTFNQMRDMVYRSIQESNTIPIGVMLANFNVLNYDALDVAANKMYELKPGFSAAQTFLQKENVVAAFLVSSIPKGTSSFGFPKWATFSCRNEYVTSVRVNFGEGNPERTFYPDGLSQSATFNTEGEKTVLFTINLNNGTQKTGRATITVTAEPQGGSSVARTLSYPSIDDISMIDSTDIWAAIPFQGYDESTASPGYGQYLTYYAEGRSQLRKPIIIIDGFDPAEERNAHNIYHRRLLYNLTPTLESKLGNELRRNTPGNGYDVIILNLPKYEYTAGTELICPFWSQLFGGTVSGGCYYEDVKKYRTGGGDYIERNAFVLVALINRVNAQLQANGSAEKIAVIGPSMGGLISRYALRYMEQNALNANCKLWVSFDSPHHGANVTLGLQFWLKIMEKISPEAGVALHEQLESPAAKQMAIQHHLGKSAGGKVYGAPGFRDRFAQTMNSMGFPQSTCMRKVALNNGSKVGTFQNYNKCAQSMKVSGELKPLVYPLTCWALLPGLFWLTKKVCDYPIMEAIAYTAPAYDEACFIAKLKLAGHYDDGYVIAGNGQPSMDLLPGAYQNLFLKVTQKAAKEKWVYQTTPEINFTNVSFIPSVSAFALKNLNRDWGASLNGINVPVDTPFDAIYAPDLNEEHTAVTKSGVDFIRTQLAIADQSCAPVNYLPLSNGCYTIKAKHSGKLMQPENANNGARIRQYGGNGQSNQIFRLESVSADAYRIISQSTSKVQAKYGNWPVVILLPAHQYNKLTGVEFTIKNGPYDLSLTDPIPLVYPVSLAWAWLMSKE